MLSISEDELGKTLAEAIRTRNSEQQVADAKFLQRKLRTTAGLLERVCLELINAKAMLRALKPVCDVCERDLDGRTSERVVVLGGEGKPDVEFTLGSCCGDQPFSIPPGAREVRLKSDG